MSGRRTPPEQGVPPGAPIADHTPPAAPDPMAPFDPSAPAPPGSGLFGLDSTPEEAQVHVLGVPFDATTSYRKGASRGPAGILRASHQVDLFDLLNGRPYEAGIWMAPEDERVLRWNEEAGRHAERVIARGGAGPGDPDAERVNAICERLDLWVRERTEASLAAGKLCALVGGDHATPFGAIAAHAARFAGLGILHFDAHADLRPAYEGFAQSHASILRNVLERLDTGPIVQVGLRDLSEEEHALIGESPRLSALFDHEWAEARQRGADLRALARRALEPLPRAVYVTFDVDGLDPTLCPGTGTPVPGGLLWHDAMAILDELVRSGRTIVGFDLNEVAPAPHAPGQPDGWDEIVGARLLYRLIGFALRSRRGGPSR